MSGFHTAQALKLLLRSETDIDVWAYGTQFNDLWSMKSATEGHAIVVWADTPADPDVRPVSTEPYVTPFDWAIAARSQYPTLKVTVIDLRPTQHDQANYPALRWLQTQRPECVPWLRRLIVSELVDLDLNDLRKRLAEWPKPAAGVPTVQPLDVLRMLPVCRYDLSPDASHHAIANLVGPLLLLRKPVEAAHSGGTADHRAAVRQLLATADLAPKPSPSGGTVDELTGRQAAIANVLGNRVRNLRLVLCDDQWHHGWLDWLCERMGVTLIPSNVKEARLQSDKQPCRVTDDGNVSIWVLSSPGWLVEKMNRLSKETKPLQRRLYLTTENEDHNEILLLDLRLFTGRKAQEEGFRKSLELPHKRFCDTMPDASSGDSVSATGTDDEAKALTLLPRTLALADPLLPIIIFSSTGKRDVIELLLDSPSVVTAFAKPRVLISAGADLRLATEEAFDLALAEALRVLRTRNLLHVLAPVPYQSGPQGSAASGAATSSSSRYVELYIDESGSDRGREMRVGGLAVVYPDSKAADNLWSSLVKTEIAAGGQQHLGYWGFHVDSCDVPSDIASGKYQPLPKAHLATDEVIRGAFSAFAEVAQQSGLLISAVMVRDLTRLSAATPDYRYRTLLAHIIEWVLAEWPDARGTSIRIYAGTRATKKPPSALLALGRDYGVPILGNPDSTEFTLETDWPTLQRAGGWFIRRQPYVPASPITRDAESAYALLFTDADVFPIIQAVAANRPGRGFHVKAARAVKLQYHGSSQDLERLPRQAHYLADYIASRPDLVPIEWWQRGFDVALSAGSSHVLAASRLLDAPGGGDAIAEAIAYWYASGDDRDTSPQRWVAARLAQRLLEIGDDGLHELFRPPLCDERLRTPMGGCTEPEIAKHVMSEMRDRGIEASVQGVKALRRVPEAEVTLRVVSELERLRTKTVLCDRPIEVPRPATGVVVQFNVERQFGFIKRNDGLMVFVHAGDCQESVTVGNSVLFEIRSGKKDRPEAANVRLKHTQTVKS